MVGFDPSTEGLCKAPPKLSKPVIAVDPLATVLDDFCPPMVVEQFTDFDSIDDWVVDYDPVEMPIGGNNQFPNGSVINTSVEESLKGIVPEALEVFGSQIEEGMEKVSFVVTSESSDQISIQSENLEELVGKGSDECVAVVQDNGSGANTSVEETHKGTADEKLFVEGAVPGELEIFGSQMEEGMKKVGFVVKSSDQISMQLENLEELDGKGSDECVAVVQDNGSGNNTIVEETLKGTADEKSFVEGAVPGELEIFGPQIEEEMEKVCLVDTSESSHQISIQSENLEVLDGKGSDECVAVVQDNGSGINTSVEKTFKETADEKPSVEAAVPGELEHFGSQLEEEMEKVCLVDTSESSDQISIKSENMEVLDQKGSDDCREVGHCVTVGVQNVTEETEVAVNGELGFKVSLATNLEKPEAVTGVSGSESVELSHGDENDSSSGSESDSSSWSSSSSSSSEEEDEKEEEEDKRDMMEVGEIEEGEIRDLDNGIAAESDDEEGECVLRGPIRSNNEPEILPPVPQVDVALEPHHQTLPVGVISSIMGTKVVVEGLEKHNPLNEGSIIWITEARLPLGLVDEIFGPVKNPYYVVRYNSVEEVPAGIHEGTPVSFVEAFANHVLNDKNLYKKGYDASGENDEELSDEVEFSDDEKEAEYRRMQRMAKRGTDDRQRGNQDLVDRKKYQQKGEFQKKIHPSAPPDSQHPANGNQPRGILNQRRTHTPSVAQQKGEFWKKIHPSAPPDPQLSACGNQPRGIRNQLHSHSPSIAAPVGCGGGFPNQHHTHTPSVAAPGGCACSHSAGPGSASMSAFVPSVSQMGQATYCPPQHLLALNNGVWTNGMQSQQQQQHAMFPSINGLPSQQQNASLPFGQHFQHPHPFFMNLPNGMPIQQQFDPSQMLLPNMTSPFGQPSFSAMPPPPTPWTGFVGQAGFNQPTFGMGFPGQLGHASMNSGEQGIMSNGPCSEQSNGLQPPGFTQGGMGFQGQLGHSSTNSGEQRVMSNGSCSEQSNELQPPGFTQGSFASPQKFHQGISSTCGRNMYRRGGSNFVRGRGRRQSG